jgi:hypothetical protein
VAQRIPIFPLGTVLLPGAPLPLHIFEPRYQQLLADVTAPGAAASFGIVALHRGGETDQDVSFASVGTLAEIVERTPGPDGSSELWLVGSRRFRIQSVDADSHPYLCAEIEWLPEEEGTLPPRLLAQTRAAYTRYRALLAIITGQEDEGGGPGLIDDGPPPTEDRRARHRREDDGPGRTAEADPPAEEPTHRPDPISASYDIASAVQLRSEDRQSLLETETAADRLAAELVLLRTENGLLRHTRSVPVALAALQIAPHRN